MADSPTAANACACASVRRTGRALTQLYDSLLAPSGLRATQFALLQHLDLEQPIAMSELALALGMDRTTLTRALAPLERQGWLLIEAGPDRRARQVRATAAGMATLALAHPYWLAAQQRVAGSFGEERLTVLRRELAVLDAVIR